MGWSRSLFYASDPIRTQEVDRVVCLAKAVGSVEHFEHAKNVTTVTADIKSPIDNQTRGLARQPCERLLSIASGGRAPVNEDRLPFIELAEVLRHNNSASGYCELLFGPSTSWAHKPFKGSL